MGMIIGDREEIYRKARLYLAAETDSRFAKEVATAIDEHADEDLYERFYTDLAFGTAGMRGMIGGGTNRINPYIVRKVTQGLARYLLEATVDPSVVIAFDSRLYSDTFALHAALVLVANGIRVFLYDSLRPVPMLSYAVRYLHATAGIVVTASHNPAKYNGYKVYWSDGGQVTPPHDIGIAAQVSVVVPEDIKTVGEADVRHTGLLSTVPVEVDEAYYQMVISGLRRPELFSASKLQVAYTPLHGSGNIPVRTMLERLGLACSVVSEQELPDGNFPTVSMPNPEDPQAMRLAVELGKTVGADIVLGTDPDADRLGIAIPVDVARQSYKLLSGNQIAVLLSDYLMRTWKEQTKGQGPVPLVVKSLVTTDLVRDIVERNGGRCVDVLTGFKYIAEQIEGVETDPGLRFLFGCEESYGYLVTGHVRDKDAVSAALCAVEMMAWYASQGMSLQHRLEELEEEYGLRTEAVFGFSYEGSSGKDRMKGIMTSFRERKPKDTFAGSEIISSIDLLAGPDVTGFPRSDVVILRFSTGEKLVVRPSGTEPKIKYYLFLSSEGEDLALFKAGLSDRIARFKSVL